MKICPKCQQQYPNGFQYCPSDTEILLTNEEFLRRTRSVSPPPMVERNTPVAERAENPSVEVVPLKNQIPDETAARPKKPVVSSTPNAPSQGIKEPSVPLPFRKPESQHPTEDTPRRPQPINRTAPPPSPRPTT